MYVNIIFLAISFHYSLQNVSLNYHSWFRYFSDNILLTFCLFRVRIGILTCIFLSRYVFKYKVVRYRIILYHPMGCSRFLKNYVCNVSYYLEIHISEGGKKVRTSADSISFYYEEHCRSISRYGTKESLKTFSIIIVGIK